MQCMQQSPLVLKAVILFGEHVCSGVPKPNEVRRTVWDVFALDRNVDASLNIGHETCWCLNEKVARQGSKESQKLEKCFVICGVVDQLGRGREHRH